MANQLSKLGIENTQTILAGHVTQSIDALTGLSAYDITISGSLILTGSVRSKDGFTGNLVGTSSWANTAVAAISSSWATNAQTASYANQFNVATGLTASGLRYPTADGTLDMFATTDGTGNLSFDWVKTLHQNIRNADSVTILRGTPLYISGSTGDNANVYVADSSATNRRPATLIAGDSSLAPGATGTGLISGEIQGVNTNAYPEGTIVYLAAGGGWTATRPTGSNTLVQALGVVTRQATNGRGIIFNQIGNNLPNIQAGYTWVGDSDDIPQATLTSSIVGGGSYGALYPSGSPAIPSAPFKFIGGASQTDVSSTVVVNITQLATKQLNQNCFITATAEDAAATTITVDPAGVPPGIKFNSSNPNTKFHYHIMYI